MRPNLSDPGAGSRSRPASACEALVDETLAQLRADLLDCGFPDDLTVTVEISAGNVAYRASVGGEAL